MIQTSHGYLPQFQNHCHFLRNFFWIYTQMVFKIKIGHWVCSVLVKHIVLRFFFWQCKELMVCVCVCSDFFMFKAINIFFLKCLSQANFELLLVFPTVFWYHMFHFSHLFLITCNTSLQLWITESHHLPSIC